MDRERQDTDKAESRRSCNTYRSSSALHLETNCTTNRMEDTRVARRQEEEEEVRLVSSDSAYGSSAMDTDTEDGQTPTDTTWPYNEDITHKVSNDLCTTSNEISLYHVLLDTISQKYSR